MEVVQENSVLRRNNPDIVACFTKSNHIKHETHPRRGSLMQNGVIWDSRGL